MIRGTGDLPGHGVGDQVGHGVPPGHGAGGRPGVGEALTGHGIPVATARSIPDMAGPAIIVIREAVLSDVPAIIDHRQDPSGVSPAIIVVLTGLQVPTLTRTMLPQRVIIVDTRLVTVDIGTQVTETVQ